MVKLLPLRKMSVCGKISREAYSLLKVRFSYESMRWYCLIDFHQPSIRAWATGKADRVRIPYFTTEGRKFEFVREGS